MSGTAPERVAYVVCGLGATGRTVAGELLSTGRAVVAVERDASIAARARAELPAATVIEGDATDGATLDRAGVRDARGLVTTLADDKLNLVITVTALDLNRSLRVVVRGLAEEHWERLRREGARVVSPNHIVGRRLAATASHPEAATFLDEMLAAPADRPIRFESVEVLPGSEADGRTIREVDIRGRTGLAVVALRRGDGGPFHYNPATDTRLAAGHRIVVIGDWRQVDALAAIAGRWE